MPRHGLKIALDRKYECRWCGTQFQYRFRVATSELDDEHATERQALVTAAKRVHNVPCPTCGQLNAQTFAAQRRTHAFVFAMVMFGAGVGILVACDVYSLRARGAWLALLSTVAVVVLLILFLLLHQPRKASRGRIKELLESGMVHSVSAGEEPKSPPADLVTKRFARLMLWPILGVIVTTAIALKIPRVGSSYNPNAIPGHVAPGQQVQIELPEKLDTIGRYWQGTPELTVQNPEEVGGPVQLVGIGLTKTWPDAIPKNEDSTLSFHPTVTVQIPDEQRLAHKTLSVRVRMVVSYPQRAGNDTTGRPVYQVKEKLIITTVLIPLTDENTVASLLRAWWTGAGLAAFCVVLPAIVLAWLCHKEFCALPPPVLSVVPSA